MTRVAVTGASGTLGRLVADQLLDRAPASEIALLTRDPDRLASYADRGADVRRADFDDPDTLGPALVGVERLLLISIDQLGAARVAAQGRAIDAARDAGVGLVAYTSLPRTDATNPANPALVAPDHAATEQQLRESGMSWTILRNNMYADMQLDALAQAGERGQWVTNAGAGAAAYVTRADCAAVAVGVLTGEGHEGQVYDVTGPQAWTSRDLADLAAERVGHAVELVEQDDGAYVAGLETAGLPAPVARMVASFGAAVRGGYLAEVSDVVARVGGRAPTSLRDLVSTRRA